MRWLRRRRKHELDERQVADAVHRGTEPEPDCGCYGSSASSAPPDPPADPGSAAGPDRV